MAKNGEKWRFCLKYSLCYDLLGVWVFLGFNIVLVWLLNVRFVCCLGCFYVNVFTVFVKTGVFLWWFWFVSGVGVKKCGQIL